jgi:5'-nucleotidase / UDP-sugar diphosphatase
MSIMRPVRSCRVLALTLWVVIGGLTPLAGAGPAPAAPQPDSDGPFDLTLFHTNDIHGAFTARPHEGQDGPLVGGFAALAGHLAREQATATRWLLLDAGDFMTGNPVCDLVVDGVRGGALAALMGAVGYHASVVGNHEFDIGRAELVDLIAAIPFPVLAADLVDRTGADAQASAVPGEPGPLVFERDGLRIGVMGVSHQRLEGLLTPARLDGITSAGQVRVLRRQLARLVPATDVQVLLSHNGFETDRELARALASDGLDVIIGGHSHTRLAEPVVEDGVLIVQAGGYLRQLGRLDLRLAAGRVTHYRGQLVLLTAEAEDEAPQPVRDLVDHFDQQVAAVYSRPIGRLTEDLRRHSRRESELGSWLCDILRESAGADVAVVNSGGIRKHLLAGPLTRLDIYEVLPFGNTLVVHSLPGESLRAILLANARAAEARSYGILQVSGVQYRYQVEDAGVELVSVQVGGQPLDDQRIYTVAMPDFVSGMGDVYLAGVPLGPQRETGESLTDIVIEFVEAAGGAVRAPQMGRMVRQ